MALGAGAGFFLAGAAALVVAAPALAFVYADRPPPAHTGGFNEPSCHSCHFDHPLDAPGGELVLEGVPEAYASGERYRITVSMAHPGMGRGGFQLSARFVEGARAGQQAGSLLALGERVEVTPDGGVQYAHHTRAGSVLSAPNSARWTLEWTAPESADGPVVFHLSANAANGDESEFGDFIYTTSAQARTEGGIRK